VEAAKPHARVFQGCHRRQTPAVDCAVYRGPTALALAGNGYIPRYDEKATHVCLPSS